MFVMLILVILFTKIRGGQTRCTPVKMVIRVDFIEQALTEEYRHVKNVLITENFRKTIKENKDKYNIDISAHASASFAGFKAGGGFRTAGGRAWEEFMKSVTNDRRNEQKERTDLKKFNKGFTQIYRITRVEITVDGAVATSKSTDYVDSAPISESPTYGELRAMAEKHIDDNYGDILGGRVEGNQYTASTCIAEGGFIPCQYRERKTVGTCSFFSCSSWRGETECVNSICQCAPNHYTPDGEICHPCEDALMVSSTGAAKEVHDWSLGTYVQTEQVSNNRPVYKNTKDNDRYLHFSPNSRWMISSKKSIGTENGWIFNTAGGETPNETDPTKWLVTLEGQPDDVKRRYTHAGTIRPWYKDPTFRIVALS